MTALTLAFAASCAGSEPAPPAEEPQVPEPPPTLPEPVAADTDAPDTVTAGAIIAVRCTVIDELGEIIEAPADATPRLRVSPADSVVRNDDGDLVATRAGEVDIACAFPSLRVLDDSPDRVRIEPGDAAEVVTAVDATSVIAGGSANATCVVYDAFGNYIESPDPAPELRLEPDEDGNTITGLSAELTRAGVYDARCDLAGTATRARRLEVVPALPANLAIDRVPDELVYAAGQIVEIAQIVTDRYGNRIVGATLPATSQPSGTPVGDARFRWASDGVYLVTARVAPPTDGNVELTQSVEIVVNGAGPQITCGGGDGPTDGEMINVAAGTEIAFTGQVADANDVARVTVAGVEASLSADGTFSAPLTTRFGINFADVVAVDSFGAESSRTCSFLAASRFIGETDPLGGAVSLSLVQEAIDDRNRGDGLDSINDLLAAVINSPGLRDTLHDALLAANPLKDSCDQRVFGACVFRSRINYRDSRIRGPNSGSLDLVGGGIRAAVTLSNVDIDLDLGGTIDTSINATFRTVAMGLVFDAALSEGRPSASVRSTEVDVSGLDVDVGGVPEFLEDIILGIFRGRIERLVEDLLRDQVRDNFGAIIDGLLAGLDISTLGTSFDVPRRDGGEPIALDFGVGFSSLDTGGSRMLFGIASRFSADVAVAQPTLGVSVPPGPVLGDPATDQPIAASVHLGLINQVLHSLWRAGLFEARITGDVLGGGLPEGVVADLSARLPPVAEMRPDGVVELGLGALGLQLTFPGLFEEPLDVVLGARASAGVTLDGNDLAFGDLAVEELHFSTGAVSLSAATREVLEGFFLSLVQRLVDGALNDALPALPIPSFALPAEVGDFGLPVGAELGIRSPSLSPEPQHFVLRGGFGVL